MIRFIPPVHSHVTHGLQPHPTPPTPKTKKREREGRGRDVHLLELRKIWWKWKWAWTLSWTRLERERWGAIQRTLGSFFWLFFVHARHCCERNIEWINLYRELFPPKKIKEIKANNYVVDLLVTVRILHYFATLGFWRQVLCFRDTKWQRYHGSLRLTQPLINGQ